MKDVDKLRRKLIEDGRPWWLCRGCGRPLDRHGRRTIPSTGGNEYLCAQSKTGRFEPKSLPQLDYTPQRGLHVP